jgi:hypothetical protein
LLSQNHNSSTCQPRHPISYSKKSLTFLSNFSMRLARNA